MYRADLPKAPLLVLAWLVALAGLSAPVRLPVPHRWPPT